MRIKTIKRSFSTIGKLIKKASRIKMDSMNDDLAAIQIRID